MSLISDPPSFPGQTGMGTEPLVDLRGRCALVIGVANEHSIAAGCARQLTRAGARVAITYLNDKAEPFVRPVAEAVGADLLLPCDVREPGSLERAVAAVGARFGVIDLALHSIAFAPREDLQGRLTDCSAEGFALAMDVSCHSFIRLARLVEPWMTRGGSLQTVTFSGAQRVIDHYNVMGPVKAALECAVRYIASELGPKGIRVHAISPGPLKTRAAMGLDHFEDLMAQAAAHAPTHHLVTIDQVGALCAFLASEAAAGMTGSVTYVDGGYNIIG